ncbi:site-specific DNA-methyltransferase [Amycolatopsis acidicola]|uniref:Methyltransferase n=1 Tax=Amycolatopsis acidicola TaxID=2596893 RepID=A0A5N0UZI9_9PSEU|nr:site-specific DNA-methyltransferase [Amycolatopsis acidicola]KAA9159458.1 site-specific DNA-methyltransferase [Amycolatopsis acidicola]
MTEPSTSTVHYRDDAITLYTGDATTTLSSLPARSVDCVVTSPPYWGLRDYGTGTWVGGIPGCEHLAAAGRDGKAPQRCRRCGARREDDQHGLEATPQDYVDRLRGVFAQLHRVLADTGTVWLNLGDSYSAGLPGHTSTPMRASTLAGRTAALPLRESVRRAAVSRTRALPPKNLIGMPWRVAFALQGDGWILRNAIVWHKPNAMPESVRDRLSNRYEMLFLLTKQQQYYFNLDPIREPTGESANSHRRRQGGDGKYHDTSAFAGKAHGDAMLPTGSRHSASHSRGKNPGDVWSIATRPLREAHFAAFPVDIPLRCIAAGSPPGGIVLDPFSGAATTGLAAHQLGRAYIGIDLNTAFHDIGLRRLTRQTAPGPAGPRERGAAA